MLIDAFVFIFSIASNVLLVGAYLHEGTKKERTVDNFSLYDRLESGVIPLILLCPASWVVALLAG